ncbi:MAG: hypothetical protein P4L35_04520 [Ignavibacteriaceae bacterium]|nr:hypothetical protein [Ignavibacteriaceae bacterium]
MSILTLDQIKDWDAIADQSDEILGLSEIERIRIKEALNFLKIEFGEDFLKENYSPIRHPFFKFITNYVRTTRLWFVDIAERILLVKNFPQYEGLLERLKNPQKYSEAMSVLESAYKFCKAGFEIEFDPCVKIGNGNKVPDIKIIDSFTQETLYCEVSFLNYSENQIKAQETEDELFNATRGYGFLETAGRVYKPLSLNHRNELISKIKELSKSVAEKQGFGTLIIDHVITLGLSTPDKKEKLQKWANKHGCNVGEFDGPPSESNDVQRMKFKIKKEQEQLPLDHPNLIVIYAPDFYFQFNDLNKTIHILEEYVYDFEHVRAVIICGSYFGEIKPLELRENDHIYFQKSKGQDSAEQYLIIWNRFCKKNISKITTEKIYRSIKEY